MQTRIQNKSFSWHSIIAHDYQHEQVVVKKPTNSSKIQHGFLILVATMLFAIGGINAQDYYQVGNGTLTTNYIPTYVYYNYGCAQMIYDSSLLFSAGMTDEETIYGISFEYNAGLEMQRYLRIYMFNPQESRFQSDSSWWNNEDIMLLVFSGEFKIDSNEGWKTIWFETPYRYSQSENIGIAVYDFSGDYHSSRGVKCSEHENSTLNVYSDYDSYSIENITNYTGVVRDKLPNIRFHHNIQNIDIYSLIPTVDAPWNETFDGTQRAIDSTWFTMNDYRFIWKFDNYPTNGMDSTGAMYGVEPYDNNGYAHIMANSPNNAEAVLISPLINMNGNSGILNFKYCNTPWGTDFDELTVMYVTPDDNDPQVLATFDTSCLTWQSVTLELPACNQIIIAFMATNGYGYGIGIDDISIGVFNSNQDNFCVNILGTRVGITNEYVSLDALEFPDAEYSWTVEGTNEIHASDASAMIRWNTEGTYTVILTGTLDNVTISDTIAVTIMIEVSQVFF